MRREPFRSNTDLRLLSTYMEYMYTVFKWLWQQLELVSRDKHSHVIPIITFLIF